MEHYKDQEKFLLIRPFIVPLKLFIQRYKEKMTEKSQSSRSGTGSKLLEAGKNKNALDLIRSEMNDDALSVSGVEIE